MVKLLLTADWHIDAVTAGVPRVDEIDGFVEKLVEVIEKEKIDFFFHLGDFFNPGKMLCSYYTAKMIEIITEISHTDVERIVLIAGNHDVIENSRGATTLSPMVAAFPCHPKIHIFEQPGATLLHVREETIAVLALPYVARACNDPQNLANVLMSVKGSGSTPLVVVGHMTVPGATVGSETKDMARGRDLDMPDLSELKPALVAAGHYHRAQRVGEVVIPGSPFRFTFGERNDENKGYTIVEIEES
jgi:DNA repair protein SbcD/Mre11